MRICVTINEIRIKITANFIDSSQNNLFLIKTGRDMKNVILDVLFSAIEHWRDSLMEVFMNMMLRL